MKIEEISKCLQECLKVPDDGNRIYAYKNEINQYLAKEGIDEKIIDIVIKGIDIDNGEILDFLIGLDERELKEVWMKIRKNSDISNGTNIKAFKLIVIMFCESLNKSGNLDKISVDIFKCMMNMINGKKSAISSSEYKKIIEKEFVECINKDCKMLNWQEVKDGENQIESFTSIMQEILSKSNFVKQQFILKKWIDEGEKYAKTEIENKKIMATIPPLRINELKELTEHYEKVEKDIKQKAYKINSLEKNIESLNEYISNLETEKIKLEIEISNLRKEVDSKNKKIEEAGKEIKERKEINNAFDALKKSDEKAMLKDIGGELKNIYRDYLNSEKDSMDMDLGEIYRDNMRRIFKTLKNKGVEFE